MKTQIGWARMLLAALGFSLLILDAKTALSGAQDGINLCIRTVIPSLFPFFVLSILLTGLLSGRNIPFLRPIGRFLGIPSGAEALMVIGFLGGYPVGAQSIAQACQNGQLSERDAKRMLGFCNNAGPAFLFGMTASLFHAPAAPWALWGIHIISALLASVVLPKGPGTAASLSPGGEMSLQKALSRSVRVMAEVCGWVVLFRVVIAILQRWCLWLLPETVQLVLTGILELTNGCCGLASLAGEGLRFLLCACFLGFGGICVAMQTLSVTGPLGPGAYFPGKGLQCCFSFFLAAAAQRLLFPANECFVPSPAVWTGFLCASLFLILYAKKMWKFPRSSCIINSEILSRRAEDAVP